VEVLQPAALRRQVADQIRDAAGIYQPRSA
jgi:hypothetical protein